MKPIITIITLLMFFACGNPDGIESKLESLSLDWDEAVVSHLDKPSSETRDKLKSIYSEFAPLYYSNDYQSSEIGVFKKHVYDLLIGGAEAYSFIQSYDTDN